MVFHLSVISLFVFPLENFILPVVLWQIIALKEIAAEFRTFRSSGLSHLLLVSTSAFTKFMHDPSGKSTVPSPALDLANIVVPILLHFRQKELWLYQVSETTDGNQVSRQWDFVVG